HLGRSLAQTGGGGEIPAVTDPAAQGGGEAWHIGEANVAAGYGQRVERPGRWLGAVALERSRQGKFPGVLAIEPGRALRPRDAAKPRGEQEAQSQRSQHTVLPLKFRLAGRGGSELKPGGHPRTP